MWVRDRYTWTGRGRIIEPNIFPNYQSGHLESVPSLSVAGQDQTGSSCVFQIHKTSGEIPREVCVCCFPFSGRSRNRFLRSLRSDLNSLFTLLTERVRCDVKRLKNRFQKCIINQLNKYTCFLLGCLSFFSYFMQVLYLTIYRKLKDETWNKIWPTLL